MHDDRITISGIDTTSGVTRETVLPADTEIVPGRAIAFFADEPDLLVDDDGEITVRENAQ